MNQTQVQDQNAPSARALKARKQELREEEKVHLITNLIVQVRVKLILLLLEQITNTILTIAFSVI